MGPEDKKLQEEAIEFAHRNKKQIAKDFASTSRHPSERNPVSIFMSGSPGAGKTEFSKELIRTLAGTDPLRIDADELRSLFPGYNGKNSSVFQPATTVLVEKVHDHAIKMDQSFILDSTFSKPNKAVLNIERSLHKDRPVFVFYVYDDPRSAWQFTQERERQEGRHIPKEAFIDEFFGAMETVDRMKVVFGDKVMIFLVRKDLANPRQGKEFVVSLTASGSTIDKYVNRKYTRDDLSAIL